MEKNKINRRILNQNLLGYSLIAPAILFAVVFLAYPFFQTIIVSFFEWDGFTAWKFVGFQNFIDLFTKERYFYLALKNTIFYSIGTTFGLIAMGFILAVLIDLKVFLWKMYRIIFFLSYSLSIVGISLLFLKIFAPEGLINIIFKSIGLDPVIWFGSSTRALLIIIFITIWQGSGFAMVFFLAGMQNINQELYEAAMLDGASLMRRIFSITIPQLKNVFSILIVMELIFSFKVFDIIYVMTAGGPNGQTSVLTILLYRQAFEFVKLGYASSIGFIMIVISVILSIFYVRFSGYRERKAR